MSGLILQYGGKNFLYGRLDTGVIDRGDVTREEIAKEVPDPAKLRQYYYIPVLIRGRRRQHLYGRL
jgi:hypothetical protein